MDVMQDIGKYCMWLFKSAVREMLNVFIMYLLSVRGQIIIIFKQQQKYYTYYM